MAKREMPAFTKAPAELVERFNAMLDEFPDVPRRKMMGYPAAFVGGHMTTGLFQDRWYVRVGDADRAELHKIDGAGPFEPMPGRAMGDYSTLPPSIVADDEAVRVWIGRAIEHARSLPPKK